MHVKSNLYSSYYWSNLYITGIQGTCILPSMNRCWLYIYMFKYQKNNTQWQVAGFLFWKFPLRLFWLLLNSDKFVNSSTMFQIVNNKFLGLLYAYWHQPMNWLHTWLYWEHFNILFGPFIDSRTDRLECWRVSSNFWMTFLWWLELFWFMSSYLWFWKNYKSM